MPRPIGWISTISRSGKHNLAPYSQFNNLTYDPPYVMFSANQTPYNNRKDTAVNAEETGKFVWNLATWELREAVNASAEFLGADVDEFDKAGLEKGWSQVVDGVPMVKDSPVRFECEYHSTLRLPGIRRWGRWILLLGVWLGCISRMR